MKLNNVALLSVNLSSDSGTDQPPTYDIDILNSTITTITPNTTSSSTTNNTSTPSSLLLPTLCHPHIHLDKPYLLTCNHHHPSPPNHPSYADLTPRSGTFPEAIANTAAAKTRFTPEDLLLRGRQLLATSFTQGVTSARSFVEVDHVTALRTLGVGLQLQREFRGKVRVQLCAFAQDPIFSSEWGEENRRVLEGALAEHAVGANGSGGVEAGGGVEVLGSTPYVESSRDASVRNIKWAVATALKYGVHLDFHLDYNLDETKAPEELVVWEVLRQLKAQSWPTRRQQGSQQKSRPPRTVVLGHCTALTLLPHTQLQRLAAEIHEADLPVYFVGLPTSDLYMMGRPPDTPPASSSSSPSSRESDAQQQQQQPMHRPRGTLNIPLLTRQYGLSCCLGVNNVGNAFTPFGTGDPLEMAGWGVGLYHAGTEADALALYTAVSTGAREAIGLVAAPAAGAEGDAGRREAQQGVKRGDDIAAFGMLLVRNEEWVGCPGVLGMKVPARQRWGVRDVVWDVPRVELRRVVR